MTSSSILDNIESDSEKTFRIGQNMSNNKIIMYVVAPGGDDAATTYIRFF